MIISRQMLNRFSACETQANLFEAERAGPPPGSQFAKGDAMRPLGVVLLLALVSIVFGAVSLALFPSSETAWAYYFRTLGAFIVLMFAANVLVRRRSTPPDESEHDAEPAVAGLKIGSWQETESGWQPTAGPVTRGDEAQDNDPPEGAMYIAGTLVQK